MVNRFLGYWDGNPTTLIPLSPKDSAPLYVEMMGGAEPIIAKGKALYDEGKYRHAREILNKLVYAEPQNREAKDLLADVFEQFGYPQESPSMRNSLIAAAYELRNGIPGGASPETTGPDLVRAMTTELRLDFLGIRLDRRQGIRGQSDHPGQRREVRGRAEQRYVDQYSRFPAHDAELTMMGAESFDEQIEAEQAKMDGNRESYEQRKTMLVQFDFGFEMTPGTGGVDLTPEQKPFQAEPPANSAGAG